MGFFYSLRKHLFLKLGHFAPFLSLPQNGLEVCFRRCSFHHWLSLRSFPCLGWIIESRPNMRLFLKFLVIESLVLAPVWPTSLPYFLPDVQIIWSGAWLDLKRLSSLADDPLMLLRHQRMRLFGKMEVAWVFFFDAAVIGAWAWIFDILIVEPLSLHGEGSLAHRGQRLLSFEPQRRWIRHSEKGLVHWRRKGKLSHPCLVLLHYSQTLTYQALPTQTFFIQPQTSNAKPTS